MKIKNKIFLLYHHVEIDHLGKDVFCVPYYLGKNNTKNVHIVFPSSKTNKQLPTMYRGVYLHRINKYLPKAFWGKRSLIFFVMQYARNIQVLMLFHLRVLTLTLGTIYKILNPKGFLYIKCDMDLPGVKQFANKLNTPTMKGKIRRMRWKFMFKRLNLLSVETKNGFNYIHQEAIFKKLHLSHKVKFIPNGFDENLLKEYDIRENNFDKKENIFLVVGRLGTEQKNTELILEACKHIDFKNWRIILVGPIEKQECNFQEYIENFFKENHNLSNKIEFTGSIFDKKLLFEYYNRSKVFLLPSRYESFGLVLTEAARFSNYIIATDVGSAKTTITNHVNYGQIIPQENANELASVMQQIIDNKIDLKTLYEHVDHQQFIQKNSWENILKDFSASEESFKE